MPNGIKRWKSNNVIIITHRKTLETKHYSLYYIVSCEIKKYIYILFVYPFKKRNLIKK